MEVSGHLCGGAPLVMKYYAGTTMATAGIPVIGGLAATTDIGGVEPINASGNPDPSLVGISLDATGTVSSTTQVDADLLITLSVRPDVIIRAKMSQGTTADTALTIGTTSAASAAGTVVTGVTTLDDSLVWGYNGSNQGIYRRADDTAGSVSQAFPEAVASGDEFLIAYNFPGACGFAAAAQPYLDLTTDFTQFDASTATLTNDNFVVIDVETMDISDDGRNNSFYLVVPAKHGFGSPGDETIT